MSVRQCKIPCEAKVSVERFEWKGPTIVNKYIELVQCRCGSAYRRIKDDRNLCRMHLATELIQEASDRGEVEKIHLEE